MSDYKYDLPPALLRQFGGLNSMMGPKKRWAIDYMELGNPISITRKVEAWDIDGALNEFDAVKNKHADRRHICRVYCESGMSNEKGCK